MIEATDDDYDGDDPGPPEYQASPEHLSEGTSDEQKFSLKPILQENICHTLENGAPIGTSNEAKKESQAGEEGDFNVTSSNATNTQHKENYHPVVSLEPINVKKSR